MTNLPYQWLSETNPGEGPQGPYYCSAGGATALGRQIAEKHLDACLQAGIKICGLNAEVMASHLGVAERYCRGEPLWRWVRKIAALKEEKVL